MRRACVGDANILIFDLSNDNLVIAILLWTSHPSIKQFYLSSVISSVTQSCLTLYDPMDCNMPVFPVHHQFPVLAQTHVHRINDVIQPSCPLLSPFPPAINFSQHQGLFQWVRLYQAAKILEFQLQHQSFQIQDWFPLGWTGWVSLQSKRLWRVFSNTTVQKHQFFCAQLSL